MTMKTTEIISRARKTAASVRELIDALEEIDNEFNPETVTEEERTLIKRLQILANQPFIESGDRLKRMFATRIVAQGSLYQNSTGRYQIKGTDHELTCGSVCEVLLPYYHSDDIARNMTWIPTAVEANEHGKYYFTARPDVSLYGVQVRVRR